MMVSMTTIAMNLNSMLIARGYASSDALLDENYEWKDGFVVFFFFYFRLSQLD